MINAVGDALAEDAEEVLADDVEDVEDAYMLVSPAHPQKSTSHTLCSGIA